MFSIIFSELNKDYPDLFNTYTNRGRTFINKYHELMVNGLSEINEKTIEKISLDVENDFQMGGLYDGIYKEFTDEVCKRLIEKIKNEK